jgi:hypothetical protein
MRDEPEATTPPYLASWTRCQPGRPLLRERLAPRPGVSRLSHRTEPKIIARRSDGVDSTLETRLDSSGGALSAQGSIQEVEAAEAIFRAAIDWLGDSYGSRVFYFERDVVYTLQTHLVERVRSEQSRSACTTTIR